MERLKIETLRFPAKIFTQVLAVLGFAIALAACSGNGGSGNAYVGINGCHNCAGLAGSSTLMNYSAQSADGSVSLVNMSLIGNPIYQTTYASSPVYSYSGPIATIGTLHVATPQRDLAGSCYLPAGTYQLETYSAGQMVSQAAMFQVLTIPAIRSVNADIELRIDIDSGAGMGFIASTQRLYAKVTIVRVGGMICNNLSGVFN